MSQKESKISHELTMSASAFLALSRARQGGGCWNERNRNHLRGGVSNWPPGNARELYCRPHLRRRQPAPIRLLRGQKTNHWTRLCLHHLAINPSSVENPLKLFLIPVSFWLHAKLGAFLFPHISTPQRLLLVCILLAVQNVPVIICCTCSKMYLACCPITLLAFHPVPPLARPASPLNEGCRCRHCPSPPRS